MGPGAGIFDRGLGARLAAIDGPPLRSVFRKLTHLGAACGGLRLRAAAVAAAGMGLAKLAGGVGEGGKRERSGEKGKIQCNPDGDSAETAKHGGAHTGGV